MADVVDRRVREWLDSQQRVTFLPSDREGSFAKVWLYDDVCVRISEIHGFLPLHDQLMKAYMAAIEHSLTCRIFEIGTLWSVKPLELSGVVFVMERLYDIPPSFSNESLLWESCERIGRFGFHNDLKLDNIMQSSEGRISPIDFDLFSPTRILVAVSLTQRIEFDFTPIFATVPFEPLIASFRSFYDYTCLSCSIPGTHPMYRKILERLHAIYTDICDSILLTVVAFIGPARARDMPIEILVRCPDVDAVSINLFDLRGNAFAHGQPDWQSFPALVVSNGVYWPDRNESSLAHDNPGSLT